MSAVAAETFVPASVFGGESTNTGGLGNGLVCLVGRGVRACRARDRRAAPSGAEGEAR